MKRNLSFLVVDDFAPMRLIVRKHLRELGFHRIEEAADGAAALQRLRVGDCDIVITGLDMPILDGLALLRAIRAEPGLARLPVFMITAEARRARIEEAIEAGIDGYLVKPFDIDTFAARLRAALDRPGAAA